jgi:DNA repair protein RadC
MKKKFKQIPPGERPREKLLEKGAGVLMDKELLAILLGKGTQNLDVMTLAEKLIPVIDKKGFRLTAEDLKQFKGIGDAKAAIVLAAIEFTRRRIKPEGFKINTPEDILPHIRHYADRKQEHFLCASINGANEVMNIRVVSIGLVNTTQVHPREVFADPLMDRASAVIVAHNHPSGDLTPSKSDISVTKRLISAGNILGIRFLDHVIFNKKSYHSFKEHDDIEELN